jgi:hypothetical protein
MTVEENIQYQVCKNAIDFSKRMIEQGIQNDNISQVQFYTEVWCRYTDEQLRVKYG